MEEKSVRENSQAHCHARWKECLQATVPPSSRAHSGQRQQCPVRQDTALAILRGGCGEIRVSEREHWRGHRGHLSSPAHCTDGTLCPGLSLQRAPKCGSCRVHSGSSPGSVSDSRGLPGVGWALAPPLPGFGQPSAKWERSAGLTLSVQKTPACDLTLTVRSVFSVRLLLPISETEGHFPQS